MSRKDVFARWKKHSLKYRIFTSTLIIVSIAFALLVVSVGVTMFFARTDLIGVWREAILYEIWSGAIGVVILYLMLDYRIRGSRRVKKVNVGLEDSHFMEKNEIARNDGFTVAKLSELENSPDGLLITATLNERRHELDVILYNPIHTLIIATTGTGKTTAYVSPFIEVLSKTKSKPCMVITDPKGELYQQHANSLQRSGYKVHLINLSNTYISTLWNPFNDVWRKTEKINAPIERVRNKYMWCDVLYNSYEEAARAQKEHAVKLNDEIYVDLQDLTYTMFPVDEKQQDKTWQQGARDLIFSVILRMWEDVRDGYMPIEKFNLYNVWWNISQYGKDDCAILREYIEYCADEKSRAPSMGGTVLVSQDRTLSSYLGSVNQYLHWMADGGVAQLTSGNEVEFNKWDEDANVLFIKVPDAKEGRHGLVSLMLVQLYKALLEKAVTNNERGETDEERLKRNCYFLMDEFGSLPAIHRFDNIVTIARSRHIYLMPVIQDYQQLNKVYGEAGASIIRNNCNVKIFMGTNDDKTRAEISEACGKQKVKSISYNESMDMGVSTSAQSVPLIYPSELSKLNDPSNKVFGNSVVLVAGMYPIKSTTTPCFKAPEAYGMDTEAEVPKKDFMIFDELKNRYDIVKLIYLKKFLNDEADLNEEVPLEEEQPPAALNQPELSRPFQTRESISEKIEHEIIDLKSKISESDYMRLLLADDGEKIQILDELAENATRSGNIFLAMNIENILSAIRYILDMAEK